MATTAETMQLTAESWDGWSVVNRDAARIESRWIEASKRAAVGRAPWYGGGHLVETRHGIRLATPVRAD